MGAGSVDVWMANEEDRAMNRRTLLASMAGTAAVGGCSAREAGAEHAGRPTLAIASEGAGRWRIRSWQWQAGAWRPVIARAKRVGAKIRFSGRIAAADRAEVVARLNA